MSTTATQQADPLASLSDDDREAVARLFRQAIAGFVGLSGASEADRTALLAELTDVRSALATLLETVDSETLLAAVDLERLPSLVDWAGIPEAVSTGDYRLAVAYENLPAFVDAPLLVESTDVREGWRRTEELREEIRDVTDAVSGTDGSVDDGPDADNPAATDSDTTDDSADDDRRASVEAANDTVERDAGLEVAKSLAGSERGRQLLVQKSVHTAAVEMRERVLDARERLAAAVEDHELRTGRVGQPDSRNPSAFSTLPRARLPTGATFSTVPTETRYSDAPNFERVYGRRFERLSED